MGTGNIPVSLSKQSLPVCCSMGNIQGCIQQTLYMPQQAYNKTINAVIKYITLISDP